MDVVGGITECEFDHVLEANYVGDVVPDPAEASEVAWMALPVAARDHAMSAASRRCMRLLPPVCGKPRVVLPDGDAARCESRRDIDEALVG